MSHTRAVSNAPCDCSRVSIGGGQLAPPGRGSAFSEPPPSVHADCESSRSLAAMRSAMSSKSCLRSALKRTAVRGEMRRSIQPSMMTLCCACSTCGSAPKRKRSSDVTAVTSCTKTLPVATFSW